MSLVPLRFGMSPCPNDMFAFWAALHGKVATPGFALTAVIEDVESLNRRALGEGDDGGAAPPLEATKLSVPAFARAADRYALLPAGAALGFGVGPLAVVRADSRLTALADLRGLRVATPGANTTAALLFSLFAPRDVTAVPMPFDRVFAAVANGDCAAGLVIHEGRFTYERHGLRALADLGALWEADTELPLALGVIAVRRDVPTRIAAALGAALRDSVRLARRDPSLPRAFVAAHAQEPSDEVLRRHIELYVNDFTEDLGERGRAAVTALLARGAEAGLLPRTAPLWVSA